MIKGFGDQSTEDVFHGISSKSARKIPQNIWSIARRKLDMINAAHRLDDLKMPPGNKLEALKGNKSGLHSIRVNDQYRVIFTWIDGNADNVIITDYH